MLSKVKKHMLILVKMIGYFIREEMQKNKNKKPTKQKITHRKNRTKKKNKKNICDKIQLMRLIANWR